MHHHASIADRLAVIILHHDKLEQSLRFRRLQPRAQRDHQCEPEEEPFHSPQFYAASFRLSFLLCLPDEGLWTLLNSQRSNVASELKPSLQDGIMNYIISNLEPAHTAPL